jgi:tetratricopeptide (TPR) repeat protein/ssDNA-binding Zn-finger/Zn-ribbon topoisomerase 1
MSPLSESFFGRPFFLVSLVLVLGLVSCSDEPLLENSVKNSSSIGHYRIPDYLGAKTCAECHSEAHEKWSDSHHFHAMEIPSEKTVRADFNGSTFENYGITTKFFRDGGKYMVKTENQKGEMEAFEVAYTFGWEPLQQYLIKFPDGRMQVLPTCWDVEKKEWYHLYPNERIAPDDPLFWTRSMQNWDHMCADCHSTNLRKVFEPSSQTFATVYSEMNVACESCHGPGRKHVEFARTGKNWNSLPDFGLADVNSTNLAQVESCAKCHARRGFVHPGHHAGSSFLDHFLPEVVQPWAPDMQVPTYHVDGQIDDEVYVYGSFVQSKMFHKGVKCVDCHDPHTVRVHAQGNQLCARCHSPKPENPTIYDSPVHHFHQPGSKGAQCVECHMPEKTYMGIDARRDHSIRIPRPDLSVKFGMPNACNRCHADKDAQWAADAIVARKGPDRPKEARHPEAFHAFRTGKPEAEKLLLEAARDPEAPAFTRAGALLALRRFLSETSFAEARRNLDANDSVVRVAAVSKLEDLPDTEVHKALLPVLSDPVLSVRTEAARILSRLSESVFGESELELFRKSFDELKQRYLCNLDRPEAHLSLGILAEDQNKTQDAKRHYRQAIERESTFVPARMNLAMLLSREKKNTEAEKLLREAVRLQPTWGQAHYSLGLLLAEDPRRLPEAIRSLERASGYWADNPRIPYNLGIAYWQSENFDQAIKALMQAINMQPDNPEFVQSLVQLSVERMRSHAQREEWREALPHARRLAELVPDNPQFRAFVSQIEQRAQ